MSATITLRRVYRFRLEPTSSQEEGFWRCAGARRFVWNWALRQKQDHYAATGTGLPEKELSARLTALKSEPDTAWLKEIDSQLVQQVLADLKKAFTSFFEKRARFPRFKSRKRDTARFRIPQRVTLTDGHLIVPKIGRVKVRQSREVEGTTKSATFKRDACGHWFISLVADVEMPAVVLPMPTPERTVGVDLGLKDAAVTSDGERVAAPRFYRAAQRTLRRAQRSLSRKVKGSANRAKARQQVARVHQKIANKRNDFCHKLTTTLVKNHDAVCIEDVSIKGLARTKLAKSLLDASMGTIRRQVTYKGQWHRRHVVAVDRFYPSSQLCHECGRKNDALTLSDRVWVCQGCGEMVDRDYNAALNIKDEGLRVLRVAAGHADTENACGECVGRPMGAALGIPA
jgi:putative transposase